MSRDQTTIQVSKDTRDLVRRQKRGGDSYNDVLEKMARQYDPDAVADDDPEADR